MASSLDKRLQRIEELLAAQINVPIMTIWLGAYADPDQVLDELIAAGKLAPADRSRVKFIRWLTAAEAGVAEPKPWDMPHGYGPPRDTTTSEPEPPVPPPPPDRSEQIARYHEAIAQLERETVQEKLDDAAARFDRTIV